MSRDFFINGATMVKVKGRAGTSIANLSELGLPADKITVTPNFKHSEINLDAWGGQIPVDLQYMLMDVNISIPLIHFDPDILDVCLRESQGGSAGPGTMPYAGVRLGSGFARFSAANCLIGLNLLAPVNGKPWRFVTAYLTGPPISVPLGTEKSVVVTNWRAIPYAADPWNNGNTSTGVVVYDHTLDT